MDGSETAYSVQDRVSTRPKVSFSETMEPIEASSLPWNTWKGEDNVMPCDEVVKVEGYGKLRLFLVSYLINHTIAAGVTASLSSRIK